MSADTLPQLVVSVGAESLPGALVPQCGGAGRRNAPVFGASLLIPVGRLQLDVGIEKHLVQGSTCAIPLVARLDGVYTDRDPQTSSQAPITIGLAAYRLLGSEQNWVMGLGAGWSTTGGHVPYIRALIGVRHGHRVRWGVDAVVDTYGIPWKSQTTEYQHGNVVKIIAERSYRDWASSVGLVLRLGFPFVGKRKAEGASS